MQSDQKSKIAPEKKNRTWSRSELLLALDLYLKYQKSLPSEKNEDVLALARTLTAMEFPGKESTTSNGLFRSISSILMKLSNFRRLDPIHTTAGKKGLTKGGKSEPEIWNEFHSKPEALSLITEAIISSIPDLHPNENTWTDSDDLSIESEEGAILTKIHRTRERRRSLVKAKHQEYLKTHDTLKCEICHFTPNEKYSDRHESIIEVHHIQPLHTLRPGQKTKLSDLALVCANCHRVIHARKHWLTPDETKELLKQTPADRPTL